MGVSYLPDGLLMWIAPKWWGPIKSAADIHDIAYAAGGTERDKETADLILKHNLEDASHSRLGRIFSALCMAFGRRHFNYHPE